PYGMFKAPVIPFKVADGFGREALASALGIAPSEIGFDDHAPVLMKGGPSFLLVPLATRAALAKARPMEPGWGTLIAGLSPYDGALDAAYVYTRGGENKNTSFRARMFAPGGGIPEDPATGSATALLARQLLGADHLKDGTHRFALEQGYEMGRP